MPAPSPKNKPSKLKRLAASLASALSARGRLGRDTGHQGVPAARPRSAPAAGAAPAKPAQPPRVRRRSIVRKPSRAPSVLAKRPGTPAATPQPPSKRAAGAKRVPALPGATVARRSIVRRPPRAPTVRKPRHTTLPAAQAERTAAAPRPQAAAPAVLSRPIPPQPPPPAAAPAPAAAPQLAAIGQAEAAAPAAGYESQFSLPSAYGEDRIVLMVKDPWWIYAYWEIRPDTERAARGQLRPEEIPGLRSVLRIYDVTGKAAPATPAFDVVLSGLATSWFIRTDAPGHAFVVDIGLLTGQGRFVQLARSNRVAAPRFGPSDQVDEAWVTTDEAYWKLFGFSAGGAADTSPTAWAQQLVPGSWSSMGVLGAAAKPAVKGFWCRVNADLVIHGTTQPRATVRIQDQTVPIRKDGSFSVRLTLPDGAQAIPIEVVSADGHTTRTITPLVSLAWGGAVQPDPTRQIPQPPETR